MSVSYFFVDLPIVIQNSVYLAQNVSDIFPKQLKKRNKVAGKLTKYLFYPCHERELTVIRTVSVSYFFVDLPIVIQNSVYLAQNVSDIFPKQLKKRNKVAGKLTKYLFYPCHERELTVIRIFGSGNLT